MRKVTILALYGRAHSTAYRVADLLFDAAHQMRMGRKREWARDFQGLDDVGKLDALDRLFASARELRFRRSTVMLADRVFCELMGDTISSFNSYVARGPVSMARYMRNVAVKVETHANQQRAQ